VLDEFVAPLLLAALVGSLDQRQQEAMAYLPDRKEHRVLRGHLRQGHAAARYDAFFVVHLAIAGCDDRAPLRLLFGRVRDDDPADVLLAFFEAPNNEPIV
jgi:hypothetical protein